MEFDAIPPRDDHGEIRRALGESVGEEVPQYGSQGKFDGPGARGQPRVLNVGVDGEMSGFSGKSQNESELPKGFQGLDDETIVVGAEGAGHGPLGGEFEFGDGGFGEEGGVGGGEGEGVGLVGGAEEGVLGRRGVEVGRGEVRGGEGGVAGGAGHGMQEGGEGGGGVFGIGRVLVGQEGGDGRRRRRRGGGVARKIVKNGACAERAMRQRNRTAAGISNRLVVVVDFVVIVAVEHQRRHREQHGHAENQPSLRCASKQVPSRAGMEHRRQTTVSVVVISIPSIVSVLIAIVAAGQMVDLR
mmetsp:Transcript_10803/g.22454  ORF Transcript_10803/g.22454 Transcript_10803/m.22454 type:complete len:300 (-) Transcript_10803:156-1055(-)